MSYAAPRVIIDLTTSTSIDASHCGALVTNTGAAGAVTITLPTGTTALKGLWFDVFVTTDQNVIVATQTTDTLFVDGDATADSIAWQTASHRIGNGAMLICLGTAGWACKLNPAATTTTIATQTIVT